MHALEPAHPDPGPPQLRRFEALYRGEFAFVWSVARHLGVPPGAIDDVVQDVFLTAYRRLDHLRFEVSPRAWLFGVTRRVSFRYRRGAARRARRHGALAELAPPPASAPQHRHDDAQQLERLLARLSDATRTVWQMTELLGMSAPEIASELGVPLNTVYSRLRLAREQLQAQVADEGVLDAWREEARQRQHPPREAQQRSWALLLPSLGSSSSGASVGLVGWVKTQTGVLTTLIASGAVAVGVATRPEPTLSAASPAVTMRAAPIDAAREVEAAPPASASTAEVAAIAGPIVTAAAASRRLSSRTAPAPVGDDQARLAEEIALIDRARAQLAADDAAAALTTLAAHAQRFPDGVLADVREAAEVDALCRRGDAGAAEAAAQQLRVDHPASAVTQRFANYRCTR